MTLNANWQKESGEARTEDYRTWRTNLGLAGVSDVDQIEYRFINHRLVVVAVVELCVADEASPDRPNGVRPGCAPSTGFFEAVVKKVSPDRPQGKFLRGLADKYGVPLLLVVYVAGKMNRGVWVHRIGGDGWKAMSLREYGERLGKLGPTQRNEQEQPKEQEQLVDNYL